MAKARKKDCGLEHAQKLGIKPGNGPDAVTKALIEKYGKEEGLKRERSIFSQKNNGLNQANYDRKNENYEDAMLISGLYDGDIIRRACNWIDQHAEVFGTRILEVGCDCGFMTTFLASRFPDSTIVALDRHASGIAIAKINAEKLGLNNIEFIQGDLEAVAGQSFDTVFSMRAVQENGGAQEWSDQVEDLSPQAQKLAEAMEAYACALASLAGEQGQVVSIERMEREPLMLGWIMALEKAGFDLCSEAYQELCCVELGQASILQAFIFSKAAQGQKQDALQAFLSCCDTFLDWELDHYVGWDAKIVYETLGGALIKGYLIEDVKAGSRDKVVLRFNKQNPETFMLYRVYGDQVALSLHPNDTMDKALAAVEGGAQQAAKDSYHQVIELTEG